MVDQEAWATVAEVETENPVTLGKGARQGASGTSALWNIVVSAFTAPLVATPSEAFPLMWFADYVYMLADTPEQLQTRCRALAETAGGPQFVGRRSPLREP